MLLRLMYGVRALSFHCNVFEHHPDMLLLFHSRPGKKEKVLADTRFVLTQTTMFIFIQADAFMKSANVYAPVKYLTICDTINNNCLF